MKYIVPDGKTISIGPNTYREGMEIPAEIAQVHGIGEPEKTSVPPVTAQDKK